mmetsp:Transcript_75933/g.158366  ORF Transcript_75933/g.158366 Transcript_75933/m.158366 type:complete len:544 (+) Transcript_75933:829-2460(+)
MKGGVFELTDVLVVGDEGDGASSLQVSSMKLARVDRTTAGGEGALPAHLSELPLTSVDVSLIWPFEGAFAVIKSIEELSNIACFSGPFDSAVAVEHVVLETALVPADTIVVRPSQHPLSMHHFVLELADVTSTIRPLEDSVLEDAVVLQCAGVHAAVGPFFGALSGCSVVCEDAGDHGAVGEPVASWPHDLTVVPQAFKLGVVRPMENTMALQLAVVELTFEPGAVGEDLLALAFDAVVLELPFVARSVGPCKLSFPLAYAVLPVPDIFDAIWPSDLPTAIHPVLGPLSRVHPTLFGALEGAVPFLHAMLEVARVAVAIGPSADALAVEDAFSKGAPILLAGWPSHDAFAPHHVLAPLAIVDATSRPGLFAIAPHISVVEFSGEIAAIRPDVVSSSMHAAVEPSSNIGVAIGKDPLILGEFVGTCHASGPIQVPGNRSWAMVDALEAIEDAVLGVREVVLSVDVLVVNSGRNHAASVLPTNLLAERKPSGAKRLHPASQSVYSPLMFRVRVATRRGESLEGEQPHPSDTTTTTTPKCEEQGGR